ncbi:PQ loop repeat protein [Clohesyomyces aquaticus]|uniref:PQ loop repeat protein n=1 Tax=Clohesyomyces aquaticus TaxID=1231657 RepID=A0A1Y1YH24_9PLEO|nr:PQ loop repeat protein [Clohesyomyces aquaticus]
MFPPSQGLRLDIDAISQICGSVSIACWIVVFSPQIIENWRRGSADGLSVVFIVVWLLGDFFNILGAVLQGVLPTMTILAVYYTFADIVLLGQFFWYEGFTLKDKIKRHGEEESPESGAPNTERTRLISDSRPTIANGNGSYTNGNSNGYHTPPRIGDIDRRHSTHSQSSFRERLFSIDGSHLSPVTPLIPDATRVEHEARSPQLAPTSTLQTVLFNLGAIVLVCASGIFGWWLSARNAAPSPPPDEQGSGSLHFNVWGQVFGYICAALYLGSRVPQLLLNYRRKSTEGISMLFFLFACIGNLTYVMSIFAYKAVCQNPRHCEPGESGAIYGRYIAVNFSWLLGSFGTLLLDAFVFIQYFMYREDDEDSEGEDIVP